MSEDSGEIYRAIPLIMAEVGVIEKSRRNPQQGYAFRGIDDAYAAFQPIFAKHGVFVVPVVKEQKREERPTRDGKGVLNYTILTVNHQFFAKDGSKIECVTVGEAMDSGDKSANKAMSAAMKYALFEVFCVPSTGDNDSENHSPETAPRPQPKAAAQVVAKMTTEQANEAHVKIMRAFEARDFSEAQSQALLNASLKKSKLPNLVAAGEEFVTKMISAVNDGSFDKLRKGK